MDDDPDPHYLRSATASPPPLFLPSPAVSQAQLAFLFGAGPLPNPSESVHFAPQPQAHAGADHGKGRPRRGTLRISTEASAGADAGYVRGSRRGRRSSCFVRRPGCQLRRSTMYGFVSTVFPAYAQAARSCSCDRSRHRMLHTCSHPAIQPLTSYRLPPSIPKIRLAVHPV
ncbi:hypothetical protein OH76DRAFT_1109733 [Lentinus brumalis]|uniref:Uncharacterized protein n=1 Tax=Lentinus brumalis TaxID=2498619 RepID=A0A371CV76_9APHY|nr:hypothetical protein OH76DRAFT_1109733 [Polyporus brumalis]